MRALEFWISRCCNRLKEFYAKIPAFQLNAVVQKELKKLEHGDELIAFLFGRMHVFNVNIDRQGAVIRQMNEQIRKQNQTIQQLKEQIQQLKS